MLPKLLQHTGQPPTKNSLAQNNNDAKIENLRFVMIKAFRYLSAHLILITPLGRKPGQCPHSPLSDKSGTKPENLKAAKKCIFLSNHRILA